MVQFLSIHFFFLGFLQFLLGFSKVPVFLCHAVLFLMLNRCVSCPSTHLHHNHFVFLLCPIFVAKNLLNVTIKK